MCSLELVLLRLPVELALYTRYSMGKIFQRRKIQKSFNYHALDGNNLKGVFA